MQLKWPMLWDLFSLFPAHAGVIQENRMENILKVSFPRTRGGDPYSTRPYLSDECFSPHTRG